MITVAVAARADNLQVCLDVRGVDIRARNKLEDAFRSELGKIPDVVLVNRQHCDLEIDVREVAGSGGLIAYSTFVEDLSQIPMALEEGGASTSSGESY
jgi:hypothetical protein